MVRLFVVAWALVVLAAAPASAWNSVGHMTIAKLAYDQLEPNRQLALFKLLKTHPHYQAFLAASRPASVESEAEWAILRSAVWADWIRPRKKESRGTAVTKYHRGEAHYVNIPFIDPKDEKFFAGKTLVNPDLPNIVTALKQRSNDLKTKTAADEDRAVAACWVMHLVGDIHQPLHNFTYFSSDKPFIAGDLGGNKFAIRAEGRKWRLHAFWDDLLGADADYSDDSTNHQAALYREAVKVAASLRGHKWSDVDTDKFMKNKSFESWSHESHELAKRAYLTSDGIRLLKAVEAPFIGRIPDEAEEVGKEYVQNARAVAERQAVLAGRRLAERLKMLVQP